MSSIQPVGQQPSAVSGVEPTSMTSPPPASYLQGTLDGVAGMLSMSTSNLQTDLKSGQSIADIASQKGVSTNSIVQYIAQKVQQQRSDSGKPPIDSNVLDQVANSAVQRHRGGHRHGHHHTQPADTASTATSSSDPSSASSTAGSLIDLLA